MDRRTHEPVDIDNANPYNMSVTARNFIIKDMLLEGSIVVYGVLGVLCHLQRAGGGYAV